MTQTAMTPAAEALADPFETLNGAALRTALMIRLQPETRRAVMACHGMYRGLKNLEDPLAIVTWITIWIRDWGLLECDAETILRSMTDPEKAQKHEFSSTVMTSLASAASYWIKRREGEAKALAARGPEIAPNEAEKVKSILSEFTQRIGVGS